MADERTRILKENLESGSSKSIKSTDEKGKQLFFHIVDARVIDAYYEKYHIVQNDIDFCSRYYKTDLEPIYQNK